MDYLIICLAALLASGLTFFSGFGLGTILLPVFGLFFPIELAVVLTAVVHFLNNIFKLVLVGKHINKTVIFQFGVPSIIAAFGGAFLLTYLTDTEALFSYHAFGREFLVTPLKLVIAVLMVFFSLLDLAPSLFNWKFDPKYLRIGGFLSGFFGGLSGHQGALRSAFLIRLNLSKESFIASGIAIAIMIDVTRLWVYTTHIKQFNSELNYSLLGASILAAFAGAYLGNKFMKKLTLNFVQYTVAIMLMIFAVLMGMGII